MQFIQIKLTKCVLFLAEGELLSLLRRDPALWGTSLTRGKALTRARIADSRECKAKARPLKP